MPPLNWIRTDLQAQGWMRHPLGCIRSIYRRKVGSCLPSAVSNRIYMSKAGSGLPSARSERISSLLFLNLTAGFGVIDSSTMRSSPRCSYNHNNSSRKRGPLQPRPKKSVKSTLAQADSYNDQINMLLDSIEHHRHLKVMEEGISFQQSSSPMLSVSRSFPHSGDFSSSQENHDNRSSMISPFSYV